MDVDIEQARDVKAGSASRRTGRLDYVAVIETAYRFDLPDEEWLTSLLSQLRPALDHGLGVFGWFFHDDLLLGRIRTPIFLDNPSWSYELSARAARLIAPELWRAVYLSPTCAPVSQAHKRYPALHGGYLDVVLPYGIRDQILVRAYDASRTGAVFSAHARQTVRLHPRRAFCLSRVAAHVAAAYRLRRHADRLPGRQTEAANSEAVLAPDGRLLDAVGEAKSPRFAAVLTAAAKRMERSRTFLRHRTPENAVALWRALVAGRWSLVETEERGGRRFIVARRNAPGVAAPAVLTPTERRVAALLALAHPQKLVAYELGLSEPTVAALARRALSRLGLRSRTELAQLFTLTASPGDCG
jgi:DNA-binding CsgD family transcriptional regulator